MQVVADFFDREMLLARLPQIRKMIREQPERGSFISTHEQRRLPAEGFVNYAKLALSRRDRRFSWTPPFEPAGPPLSQVGRVRPHGILPHHAGRCRLVGSRKGQ